MDERLTELREAQSLPAPVRLEEVRGSDDPLDDHRALSILTTEHWSLLSARSLVYNATFSRVGMLLTFLSATLVALRLVSTATGFSRDFLMVAALTFGVDLFIGLASMGRVIDATAEDLRYVGGMNRLRHAYHDMVPGVQRYFITGKHDDARGAWAIYDDADVLAPTSTWTALAHGFTTMPGLMSALCSVVFALLVDVVLLLATDAPMPSAAGGIAAFALGVALSQFVMIRSIRRFATSLRPEFPSPASGPTR